jgi:SOS-response transcriptional repressor LexA
MKLISKRQAELLDIIERSEICPSYREMAERLGIRSTNAVYDLMDSLERKKRIERPGSKARGVLVVDPLTAEERELFGLAKINRCLCCGAVMRGAEPEPSSPSVE